MALQMQKQELLSLLSPHISFRESSDPENVPGICPFHKDGQEETPSFYLYVGPTRNSRQVTGSAFCHRCHRGWSLTGLLRAFKINRESIDSLKEIIAEQTDVKKEYYDKICLDVPKLPEALLGAFEYAPRELLESGFKKALLKELDIGFDRDRKRITFPIRDHHGNLVGVSGRTVTGEQPRYKVYKSEFQGVQSNYALNKGRVIWGLDRFYLTAMHAGLQSPVVVCEGFKAAIWCIQNGFDNTVALMGVYLTPEQKLLLSRVTNEVIVFLDNDLPGREATNNLVSQLANCMDVSVANYPANGLSPDDLKKVQLTRALTQPLTIREWRNKYGYEHKVFRRDGSIQRFPRAQ